MTLELTLQTPHATVHSSLVAEAWFAWHSMHRSMMWFRQMAQLSTTMSGREIGWELRPSWDASAVLDLPQAHRATAFH